MKTLILTILMTLVATADAAEEKLTPQQSAQARADWIVRQPRGYWWHPPYRIANPWRAGARFEGCGFGRPKQNVTWSCRPRRRMKLVADAYATGPIMSVRVRLWR